MVAVSQSPMVIDTQEALMRSLRGRFKEDYLLQ